MTDSQVAPETKIRLLDAAEALFADHGFTGTSLRQITHAAAANLAAVNYHFGSKEGLLHAVFERRLVPLNRERIERIAAVQAATPAGEVPPLDDVLVAFLEPALRLGGRPDGERFLRLLGRLHAEPERTPVKELFLKQFGEIREWFLPLMARALPELPAHEFYWRVHFLIGAMAHTMMCSDGLEFLSGGDCDARDVDGALQHLVAFAAAGLRAPSNGGAR